MKLAETVTVITGAARGIGRALGERLLAQGGRVIFSDVDGAALAETVRQVASPLATGVQADVTSATEVTRLATQAGRFNVWINNAGVARHRAILDYTERDIDLMLAVNLKGTILGSQAALRAMASRGGHIVNILSTAALRGVPTETVYCASKWGGRGFTQGLREEAAPLGVRVSAVLPGGVNTAFWQGTGRNQPLPVADWLTPYQVADAVLALLALHEPAVPQELVLRAQRDRDFSS